MSDNAIVYLIDDDRDLREAIQETLDEAGFPTRCFSRASEALKVLDPEWSGVIVSDMKMPGLSGAEFLVQAKAQVPDVPFIMITAHGDISTAIEAIKAGAYDFIEKPASPEYLISVVKRALEMRRLQQDNARMLGQLASGGDLSTRILGQSRVIKYVRTAILAVAPLAVDVLVTGQTGTGKELAARCIHEFSPRAEAEFVIVDCAMQSFDNFEHDWFSETGYIARAKAGTLLLDSLEAFGPALQSRLLRYLEDRSTTADSPRVIAALKSDPLELMESGRLRPAFYHRLNVTNVQLPLLKDRGSDLQLLLEYFLRDAAARHNLALPVISREQLTDFQHYDWPGNVRELRNAAEKLVIGLDVRLDRSTETGLMISDGYDKAMENFEQELLKNALLQAGGRKGKAADILGIPRKRLYLRMKQYGL